MTSIITTEHYGGKVKIHFYPDSHRYRKDTEKTYLLSATAITGVIDKSRVLMKWASNIAREYAENYVKENKKDEFSQSEFLNVIAQAVNQYEVKREEAASIGSQVHKWVEDFATAKINKTEVPKIEESLDQRIVMGINAFLDWYNGNKVKFIEVEKILYSKKYNFCGIADAIAVVNGKKTLIDYKTAKGVYIDYEFQLAGYAVAYEEEFGKLDNAIILHFNKETGEVFTHTVEEVEENKKAFLSALTLKKILKVRDKWES